MSFILLFFCSFAVEHDKINLKKYLFAYVIYYLWDALLMMGRIYILLLERKKLIGRMS